MTHATSGARDGRTRPRVAMALYGDPTFDGRVQKEALTLTRAGYRVTLLALQGRDQLGSPIPGVDVVGMRPTASKVIPGTQSPFHPDDPGTSPAVRGGRIGWAVGYAANLRSWGRWAIRAAGTPDLWHAHDFTGLVALALGGLARKTPLVYDSHELFLESGSAARMPRPMRAALGAVEGRLARGALGVITINQAIAGELSRRYRVDPLVVMNCPQHVEVSRPGRMRHALGLADQQVMLYHGAVSAERGIEVAVEALADLPSSVVFVVLGDGALVPWVRQQQDRPELSGRLLWHPAVPLTELLSWVVDADLGLILHAPSEMNMLLSTPNKLFECLAAGVPVVVSDFPELGRIVSGGDVGRTCDPSDPRAVAEVVSQLLADPARLAALRERASAAARNIYNWDAQAAGLIELYRRILPPGEAQQGPR